MLISFTYFACAKHVLKLFYIFFINLTLNLKLLKNLNLKHKMPA
jgi:hypothetical protein